MEKQVFDFAFNINIVSLEKLVVYFQHVKETDKHWFCNYAKKRRSYFTSIFSDAEVKVIIPRKIANFARNFGFNWVCYK